MYDNVRSSYKPFGEDFYGQNQTKEIEEGYGGTLSQYWISPEGQLYLIDYSHTADFIELQEPLQEGDEGYEPEKTIFNFRWIPNGTHGKVRPWNITKYITIYPEGWKGGWETCPDCRIHFRDGKVQDFEILTKGERL